MTKFHEKIGNLFISYYDLKDGNFEIHLTDKIDKSISFDNDICMLTLVQFLLRHEIPFTTFINTSNESTNTNNPKKEAK